ncbi:MAG: hypothetical protein QOD07_2503, partial [Frankiaceae bacterium]|nr:hypothetical protein [Frankiaceae bacterium]
NQKVVGVVALDGPKGYHAQLARPEIESAVGSAAATIRELLYGDA